MSNIVAIVGRPNVGKSTIFNRFTESRQAITDEVSGVTRDRHYGKAEWNGREFSVIDTGGYVKGSTDIFESEIRKQVELAIDEANVILFIVDVKSGVTDLDLAVVKLLRKSNKKVVLGVNKVDNSTLLEDAVEFYNLGLGDFIPVASISGSGTGELLDALVKHFDDDISIEVDIAPKFAVIGRPNVGKSSIINKLIGKEQNIVTDIAGTTRDSLNTKYTQFGFDFVLVDTAGLRKKKNVHEDLEFYSVMRSVRAIEHSDVCILVIDAERGFESQDQRIFHIADRNKKGIVILVNKWDLLDKSTETAKKAEEQIKSKIAPFTDIPIVFVSALEKQRLLKGLETAILVHKNRTQKIATSVLNEVMLPLIEHNPPPATKGKYIQIKYCTQLPTDTPTFVFFANLPQYIKEPYKRYIENQLREHFTFSGVPIQIYFRKK
ncbi:MAG: ribosome biogenesis GTPase Der [Flavobacteriales bacterium]|jgi:GTP-binding protein|nr:ribosome biogenesis GTPase Der [Flavobacteriales bacterium]MDG2085829.1 ribosome biogenesis GTPase Der [Flavobacteriales bacterium]|tara:strand:- start:3974 stop:5278 length:1305 start_codon:yes stop_codon:yes gene_type:complete